MYVSVHFYLILPRRPFEAAHICCGVGHSQPCQWAQSVAASKSSDAEKGELFSSGPMAFGDLPAVQTHGLSIMMVSYAYM
jgi:hypothetical protein